MATMKLRDFVETSLTEIMHGIMAAQRNEEVGAQIAKGAIGGMKFPESSGVYYEARLLATTVKFDVAVTVDQNVGGKADASFDIGVARGGLGGGAETSESSTSRLQFAVPLILPRAEHTRQAE